eukprot:ctg_964.g410
MGEHDADPGSLPDGLFDIFNVKQSKRPPKRVRSSSPSDADASDLEALLDDQVPPPATGVAEATVSPGQPANGAALPPRKPLFSASLLPTNFPRTVEFRVTRTPGKAADGDDAGTSDAHRGRLAADQSPAGQTVQIRAGCLPSGGLQVPRDRRIGAGGSAHLRRQDRRRRVRGGHVAARASARHLYFADQSAEQPKVPRAAGGVWRGRPHDRRRDHQPGRQLPGHDHGDPALDAVSRLGGRRSVGGEHHPVARLGAVRVSVGDHPECGGVCRMGGHVTLPAVPHHLHRQAAGAVAALRAAAGRRLDHAVGGRAGRVARTQLCQTAGIGSGYRTRCRPLARRPQRAPRHRHPHSTGANGHGAQPGSADRVLVQPAGVRGARAAGDETRLARRRGEGVGGQGVRQRSGAQVRYWHSPFRSAAAAQGGGGDSVPGGAGESAFRHRDVRHGPQHAREDGDLHRALAAHAHRTVGRAAQHVPPGVQYAAEFASLGARRPGVHDIALVCAVSAEQHAQATVARGDRAGGGSGNGGVGSGGACSAGVCRAAGGVAPQHRRVGIAGVEYTGARAVGASRAAGAVGWQEAMGGGGRGGVER